MSPVLRNILAVIAGIVLGSVVNMSILNVGRSIIPPPEGADVSTMEGLAASMHLFEPQHFVMPYLAHAVGTLLGALAAGAIAVSHKMKIALSIGVWFLAGGIVSIFLLPSPVWFTVLDLASAYLPTAYIAGRLTARRASVTPSTDTPQ